MDKAKHYLLKARDYLSKFKKMEKKGGPPKLKITNKKTINLVVIGGISFLLFVGLTGAIRAITLSNQVSKLEKNVEVLHAKKTQAPVEEKQYDYKLQYYLNDFVYAYFSLKKLKNKKDT